MTTEWERQLVDDLHELADYEPAMPDLAAIERRGRALRRRRLAARSTAGVAIVAGATVLAAAANTGPAPTDLPSAHTIAVRMAAAIKQATSDSTYITTIDEGYRILTTYTDLSASAVELVDTTESGTLQFKIGMRWHGSRWDTRVIDYGHRTWHETTRHVVKGATPGPDDFGAIAGPAGPVDPAPQFANALDLDQLLSTGQSQNKNLGVTYTITGTETVDGQLCYRVVVSGGQHITLWINKATALPVKTVNRIGGDTLTFTYRWRVPRDQAPASLWPSPPPGFTHRETR